MPIIYLVLALQRAPQIPWIKLTLSFVKDEGDALKIWEEYWKIYYHFYRFLLKIILSIGYYLYL